MRRTMATEAQNAPTRLVYQYDEGIREHSTSIRSSQLFSALPPEEQSLYKEGDDKTYALELEETIFYVQGGGQQCDTGSIAGNGSEEQNFRVHSVRYGAEGRTLHFGHFTSPKASFDKGQPVVLRIDGARRLLNSRIHTAGHIVSLALRRVAAKNADLDVTEWKASHYPSAAFVDFKGLIDGKHKDAVQEEATALVAASLPITIAWYAPEELKENNVIMPEGMQLVSSRENGKVRVVDIVGAGPGGSSGAYPCGGTHVEDSSKVGKVIIKKISRSKGNSKISYEVGDQ